MRAVGQNYQKHAPSDDEPWWSVVTTTDDPQYARARALSAFLRDIANGPSLLMKERKIAYRRRCVEHWQHYIATGAPPEEH